MSTLEAGDLEGLFEDLKENVDDLENALAPLLSSTVVDVASKLPLLDKAKLQVMVTYAIESLLFCMSLSRSRETTQSRARQLNAFHSYSQAQRHRCA